MTTTLRRSLLVTGLVGLLALTACQSDADDSGTPSAAESVAASAATESAAASAAPSESAAAGDGEETSVFDLEVGDCFSAVGDEAETVDVVDCAETHRYEVFALVEHPAGDDEEYPGDDPIGEYGDDECRAPFTEYVGHDYESSIYWITTLTPSEETWADGDREIVCTLRLGEEGEETTGSAEGTNQ